MAGSESTQGRAIFISYRRDDSEGEAGRLFDDLVRAYGDDSVFMDVTGIEPGLDFRKAIDANVAGCGVLLAMIGPTWATVKDAEGNLRLNSPNDFVRLEIASALKRGIAVIPVLVHGAKMPPLEVLPEDLKDLRYRNSVELTHARWNSDVALLTAALKSYVSVKKSQETETVHATVPVQLPAPGSAASSSNGNKGRLYPIAIAALILLAIVGGVLFYLHSQSQSAAEPQQAAVGQPAASTPATGTQTVPQTQTGMPAAETALLGKWKLASAPKGDDNLERVEVVIFEGRLMVQAWGKCPERACDWGSKRASMHGDSAVTDTWELRNTPQETRAQRSATLSLTAAGDGLQVAVKNRYQTPNGQTKDVYNQLQLQKVQ